jgi:hypothetical protein
LSNSCATAITRNDKEKRFFAHAKKRFFVSLEKTCARKNQNWKKYRINWNYCDSKLQEAYMPCVPGSPPITVPLSPLIAFAALSREAITARLPGALLAKAIAACTLGSILPGAKCPSAQ